MTHRIAVSVMLALFLAGCSADNNKQTSQHDHEAVTKAAEENPAGESRGISFPISCSAENQAAFGRGLFLLHNMMYKQAEAEFESGIASDDTCAMLYWGVAMTQFQPKWPGDPTEQALRKGAGAVERARSIAESVTGTTDREKGYIEAVSAYYKDWQNSDRDTRRNRWRDAQGELAGKYPEDDEAKIFFALAQLTTTAPNDFEGLLHSAKQLEIILKKRPKHPGVLHYLLHAYDNPVYAHRGVEAAGAYENVAPDAPHALHMPSHIYVRLGDWEKVIEWNIRSRKAAENQPVENGRVSRHFLHALDYTVYAYLQTGNDEMARREAARIETDTRWQLNSGPAAYALAAIPARIAIESRAWKEAAGLEPRAISYTWDGYPWAEAITHATRGLGAARSGDPEAALESIGELDRLKTFTTSNWWQERIDVQRDVIAGWIAWEEGQTGEALTLLSGAAEQELASGKQSVEPGHVLNAVEQLGELLIKSDRPKEALEIYQRSLEESPQRFHSLAGAGNAAGKAGMNEEAEAYYTELVGMAVAGSKRPEVRHAADFPGEQKNR